MVNLFLSIPVMREFFSVMVDTFLEVFYSLAKHSWRVGCKTEKSLSLVKERVGLG